MQDSAYQRIKASGKLPSPSGVALELLRLVDDETAAIDKITTTVEADPAISSRLLKVVNSPLSGVSRTVTSVSMAVKLLGLHTVRNLALGFSLLSANRDGASKAFDFERFWAESLARGVAARNLADHFGCCAPDEAFTVALLSKVGRLALASAFPTAYDNVLEQAGLCPSPSLAEAERRAFDIDHNNLAAEMMADWRLGKVFCESVRHQDAIGQLPPEDDSRTAKIARMLHLAGKMASILAGSNVYREDLAELLRTADNFGLDTDDFTSRFDSLKEEWPDVAAVFSVHVQAAPSLCEVHTRASRYDGSILVVDDDPSVLRLLTKYLADAGYEVLTASNGVEALRLIQSEGCQLIITDWMMPEMDGLQLCRAVRESEGVGFVYVIVLTGQSDADSLTTAFEAGADDFLTKPCQKQELLSRLKVGVRTQAAEANQAKQQRAIQKTNAELAVLNDKLRKMATTDELTGLYNRREAMRRLEDHWATAVRQGRPFACMLLDIDHFKKCNDTYGHDAGDAVLRETALVLERSTRGGETVFRIGGEEFVVLCPGATGEEAVVGAERIRAAVEANQITRNDATLSVTISIGVSERKSGTDKPDDLLKLADEALYEAKRSGRNRVCLAGGNASTVPHCLPREKSKV